MSAIQELIEVASHDTKVILMGLDKDAAKEYAALEANAVQFEKVRKNAGEVMVELLNGNIAHAKRKAKWWLTLYQCSGVK